MVHSRNFNCTNRPMGNNMKKVLYLNGGGGMERKPPGKSILKQQAISPHYSNPLLTDNLIYNLLLKELRSYLWNLLSLSRKALKDTCLKLNRLQENESAQKKQAIKP